MDIRLLSRFGLPNKTNVQYDRIYSVNVIETPVEEIFSKYFNNRGGNSMDKHVREIRDAIIREGGMDKFPPITVDINTNVIADGNCRFTAAMEIKESGALDELYIRVIFEDIEQSEFDTRVIELNMGQQSWKLNDFIYNYSLRGKESFSKLIKFCDRNESLHDKNGKINPRYAASALNVPASKLKDINLVITDEDVERGNEVVYEANEIRKKFSSDLKANGGGWYEPFLRAWSEYRDKLGTVTFKDFLREVNQSVKYRKREVNVPYGSNKKQDWNMFFRAVHSYVNEAA